MMGWLRRLLGPRQQIISPPPRLDLKAACIAKHATQQQRASAVAELRQELARMRPEQDFAAILLPKERRHGR